MAVSVIQGNNDSGWKTLSEGISYRKKNGIVMVFIEGVASSATSGTQVLGTLPSGYRPDRNKQYYLRKGDTLLQAWLTSGGVLNYSARSASGNIAGFAVFFQDN